MKENALQCLHNGGTPGLGYDVDETQHIVINEEEAKIVAIIYSMYLSGYSCKVITEVQKKAYAEYLQKEDELFRKFTEVLEASGADRTALPKVLYIDKEGNYGWICFALWNDKCIGVLLSEDVPSILSEKRLRNYRRRTMSVKPEEFGFSNRFFGVLSCNVFVWGEETEICVDKEKRPLEDLVPLVNKLISYLNHNEDIVFKAIVDDAGMLKKAEYYIDCNYSEPC